MGNFLLGLGIGLTVGVLMAPKSGSETRKYIADKTAEGTDYLMEQGRQLRDTATKWTDTASDLIDRGRNAVMTQKEKLADVASSVAGEARRQYQRTTV